MGLFDLTYGDVANQPLGGKRKAPATPVPQGIAAPSVPQAPALPPPQSAVAMPAAGIAANAASFMRAHQAGDAAAISYQRPDLPSGKTPPAPLPTMEMPAGIARNTATNPNPQAAPATIADLRSPQMPSPMVMRPSAPPTANPETAMPATQAAPQAAAPAVRPWYAGTSTADERTGLEMERERRAMATQTGAINDPVKSALMFGVAGNPAEAKPNEMANGTTSPAIAGLLKEAESPGTLPNDGPQQPTGANAAILAEQRTPELGGRQAGYMIDNNLRQFEDKGSGIARQVGADGKTMLTNVGTADVTDPGKTVPVNAYNGAADNASLAKANAIRQEMIDRQPQGGFNAMEDPNAAWNARMDRQSILSNMQDAMKRAGTRTERAALGQAMNTALAGENQLATEAMRGQNQAAAEQGRNAIQRRGQDINAQNEAARLAIDAPYRQSQTAGQEQQNRSASVIADLQQKAIGGDAKALETLRAINGKSSPATDRFMSVQGGEEIGPDGVTKIKRPGGVFDAQTGRFVPMGQSPNTAGADKIKADMQAGKISRDEAIKQLKAMGYQ